VSVTPRATPKVIKGRQSLPDTSESRSVAVVSPVLSSHDFTFKMEAADDTSETQSQTQADLLWDHTGDVESDPLLGRDAGCEQLASTFRSVQRWLSFLDNRAWQIGALSAKE